MYSHYTSLPVHVNLQRFCKDFMVPRQFTEILWCADYVNLQRFYGAPTMSIYRDFMVPRLCQSTEIFWCPDYVNLQRFCRDFLVPRLCQFTEILWCPDCVNLQRFCRDFVVPRLCQFTEILWWSINRDFT